MVGLGTAGLYSSRAAQRFNRRARVTIFEKRGYHMFSPCGIPYALGGMVESFESLKHTVPTTRSLEIFLRHEVVDGDTVGKRVKVVDLDSGEERWVEYDSLILATGSVPRVLDVPGAREFLGRGVYTVSTPEDGERLRRLAEESEACCVVGGGAIGMEIALALRHLGLEVHITKRSEQPLPRNIDPDMGGLLLDHLVEKGLKVYFGKGIDSINGSGKVESVTIAGETIPVDFVVMSVGVDGNVELAKRMGLECEGGAIKTNRRMETSAPDVYAVGDNCWSFSLIDGSPTRVALATTAYRQALVAGVNAAGGDAEYEGTLGTFVSYVGDLEVSSTGFNTRAAEAAGFRVVSGRVNTLTKPSFIPGAKPISLKVLADADSGRVLGAHAVGEEGTDWRINMVALAIRKGMTLEELSRVELAYCPPVSELYDPLLMAVDVALRKLEAARRRAS